MGSQTSCIGGGDWFSDSLELQNFGTLRVTIDRCGGLDTKDPYVMVSRLDGGHLGTTPVSRRKVDGMVVWRHEITIDLNEQSCDSIGAELLSIDLLFMIKEAHRPTFHTHNSTDGAAKLRVLPIDCKKPTHFYLKLSPRGMLELSCLFEHPKQSIPVEAHPIPGDELRGEVHHHHHHHHHGGSSASSISSRASSQPSRSSSQHRESKGHRRSSSQNSSGTQNSGPKQQPQHRKTNSFEEDRDM